jgi:hypothetical protein
MATLQLLELPVTPTSAASRAPAGVQQRVRSRELRSIRWLGGTLYSMR